MQARHLNHLPVNAPHELLANSKGGSVCHAKPMHSLTRIHGLRQPYHSAGFIRVHRHIQKMLHFAKLACMTPVYQSIFYAIQQRAALEHQHVICTPNQIQDGTLSVKHEQTWIGIRCHEAFVEQHLLSFSCHCPEACFSPYRAFQR
jgi:hypothetical protein